MKTLRTILCQILKENNKYSFTRCMPFAGYILFAIVSIYLVYKNATWTHYETFAAITGGGSLATQIANKTINSKYNNTSCNGYDDTVSEMSNPKPPIMRKNLSKGSEV